MKQRLYELAMWSKWFSLPRYHSPHYVEIKIFHLDEINNDEKYGIIGRKISSFVNDASSVTFIDISTHLSLIFISEVAKRNYTTLINHRPEIVTELRRQLVAEKIEDGAPFVRGWVTGGMQKGGEQTWRHSLLSWQF